MVAVVYEHHTAGWVKLRYSVLANGTTANVRVVDVLPRQSLKRNAVAAFKDWTFTPAQVQGRPVDWHNNVAVITFDIEEMPSGTSPFFSAAYMEVEEKIADSNYKQAISKNKRMLRESTWRLQEIGFVQMQLALMEYARSDYHAARKAILQATEPGVEQLALEEMKVALQYQFVIEFKLGRYTDSLHTYSRLMELDPLPENNPLAKQVQSIKTALAGETAIAVSARIDKDSWAYEPSRRIFTIAEINGKVREINVECNLKKVVLPYKENVEWSLPESWGDCAFFFEGKKGTTFTLYEFKK